MFVAAVATVAAGSLAVIAGVPAGQLTERPLAGALTHPEIGYYAKPAHDEVGALSRSVETGSVHLDFDEGTGYLRPVLSALHVPVASQMLVMSKTGIQALYTEPGKPTRHLLQ